MATNPYSYGSLGQRWTVGEPTSKSLLDVSRVKADANRWALEQLVVDPDDTANFVLTAPGLNIDSNTLYVDSVNNSVGFGLTNPNDYAFNGTPSWVASGGAGNASVIVVSGTTSIGYLAFADGTTGTDRYSGNIQYNHGTNTMSFRTNGGVEAMTINSTQDLAVGTDKLFVDVSASRVGIGTQSPDGLLHLKDGNGTEPSFASDDYLIIQNNNDASDSARMTIISGTSGYGRIGFGDSGGRDRGRIAYNHADDSLGFGTNGSAATNLVLDASGNLSLSAGYVTVAGNPSASAIGSNGNGQIGGLTGNGLFMYGKGSTYDLALANANTSVALAIPTGGSALPDVYIPNSLGIGTDSPTCRLDLAGTGGGSPTGAVPAGGVFVRVTDTATVGEGAVLRLQATNGAKETAATISAVHSSSNNGDLTFAVYSGGATHGERMRLDSSGNLLIGYTSSNGSYKLQVNSQIFATNATIATSDGRYKEDVQTLSNATNLVSRLNPVQFKWKAHEIHNLDVGKTDVGFIAQEVQEVLSDTDYSDSVVVTNKTDDEEYLGLGETKLIPLLTAALQEAITKIETLETKVAALEAA